MSQVTQLPLSHIEKVAMSTLRKRETEQVAFCAASDIISYALAHAASSFRGLREVSIQTPLTETTGYEFTDNVVLLPILRAGTAMLGPFKNIFPTARVAYLLLQRNEETAEPEAYYDKFPDIQEDEKVMIIDPMLATGGSMAYTIKELLNRGIPEERIIVVSILAAPEGIKRIQSEFPKVPILTAAIDDHLNEHAFIVPGLGDFGDRYHGTV